MAATDPNQIAKDWSSRLAGAGDKITRGIQGVQVAPGAAAARQKGAYVANVTASADKWAANVGKVGLSEWQQDAISKGVPRIATGAQAAEAKFGQFMAQVLPHIQAGKAALPSRGNLEQNIARSVAFQRHMAQFRKR